MQPPENLQTIFEYMLDKEYITLQDSIVPGVTPAATRDAAAVNFSGTRLKRLDENYDLFAADNISECPKRSQRSSAGHHLINVSRLIDGELYKLKVTEENLLAGLGRHRYETQLFINIERDGLRLTLPIFKLFFIHDNILQATIHGTNVVIKITINDNDNFIISNGDNFRTMMRMVKNQTKYKNKMRVELAGHNAFSDEQL